MSEKSIDPALLAEATQGMENLRRTLKAQSSGDTPPPLQPTVDQSIEDQEIADAEQAIREANESRVIGDTPLPGPLPIYDEVPTNNSGGPNNDDTPATAIPLPPPAKKLSFLDKLRGRK